MASLYIARMITLLIAFALSIAFYSPRWITSFYIILRPFIQPYTNLHYTLLYIFPLSSILSMLLISSAIITGFFKKGSTVNIRYLNTLYVILFLCIFSLINTVSLVDSIAGIMKLLTAIAFSILAYNAIQKPEDLKKILTGFALSSVIPMAFGYYQKITGFTYSWKASHIYAGKRIDSLFGHWNEYGIFLSLIFIVILILFFIEKKDVYKSLWIILLVSAIISQVLSLNRGTWVALTFGFLTAFMFYRKKIRFRWYILIFCLIAVFFSSIIIERFLELGETTPWGTSKNTFRGRIQHWTSLLSLVKNHLFIGYGIGTSTLVAKIHLKRITPPHNDYLRIIIDVGIIGFCTYTFLLFKQLYINVKRSFNQEHWRVNFPILACTIYFMTISITQNIFSDVILFPLFLGILSATHKWNMLISSASRDHGVIQAQAL